MSVRILTREDTPALNTFLSAHWRTAMFLRSNLRQTPIGDAGRFAGCYAAKFEGDAVTDAAAYFETFGTVIVQATTDAAAVAVACVPEGKSIKGVIGPFDQVEAAMDALDLRARPTAMDKPEILYALRLCDLKTPEGLRDGSLRCRRGVKGDLDLLSSWRIDYSIETLFAQNDDALAKNSREDIFHAVGAGDVFVLEAVEKPVAMAAFNAKLPDVVQIGGVWTPPNLRGKGYGRAVTGGALLAARADGADKAVLFTPESNFPAQRAYESLGFERAGKYGVVLFSA